jgi:enoyl-CoA hydratase/carnithine racemase
MKNDHKITWEIIGNIGVLTLNNPPENNIEVPDFIITDDLLNWVNKNEIKGLILTGMGRHFSAGANLQELKLLSKNLTDLKSRIDKGNNLLNTIESLEIPVIAAIKGVCFGAGLEIALACHIRICSDKALFAFPEINHSLIPGLGGVQRLSNTISKSKALEIIMEGNIINAEKAIELHLADYIVDSSKLVEYCTDLLNNMTSDKPKELINAVIRSINNYGKLPIDDAIKLEAELFCQLAFQKFSGK